MSATVWRACAESQDALALTTIVSPSHSSSTAHRPSRRPRSASWPRPRAGPPGRPAARARRAAAHVSGTWRRSRGVGDAVLGRALHGRHRGPVRGGRGTGRQRCRRRLLRRGRGRLLGRRSLLGRCLGIRGLRLRRSLLGSWLLRCRFLGSRHGNLQWDPAGGRGPGQYTRRRSGQPATRPDTVAACSSDCRRSSSRPWHSPIVVPAARHPRTPSRPSSWRCGSERPASRRRLADGRRRWCWCTTDDPSGLRRKPLAGLTAASPDEASSFADLLAVTSADTHLSLDLKAPRTGSSPRPRRSSRSATSSLAVQPVVRRAGGTAGHRRRCPARSLHQARRAPPRPRASRR